MNRKSLESNFALRTAVITVFIFKKSCAPFRAIEKMFNCNVIVSAVSYVLNIDKMKLTVSPKSVESMFNCHRVIVFTVQLVLFRKSHY